MKRLFCLRCPSGWGGGAPVQEGFCRREQQISVTPPRAVGCRIAAAQGDNGAGIRHLHPGKGGDSFHTVRRGAERCPRCPILSRGSGLFWDLALGTALPGSAAEAALPSAMQTDPPASTPTSKPSSSSPPRDSLTPGPGPSAAALLRQPPAKVPATDTIGECSAAQVPDLWDSGAAPLPWLAVRDLPTLLTRCFVPSAAGPGAEVTPPLAARRPCPWGDARSHPLPGVSPRAALRSPLSVSSPYTSSFGLVPHATLNGELPAPSVYMGVHLSPQVSSTVMYSRSPVVSHRERGPVCQHVLAVPPVPGCPRYTWSPARSVCTAAGSSGWGCSPGGAQSGGVWVVGPVEAAELSERPPLVPLRCSCVFGSTFWPLSLPRGGSSKQGPCAELSKGSQPSCPLLGSGPSLIICSLLCAGGF